MCMCIHMYTYIYVHMYTHAYIHIHIHIHIHIQITNIHSLDGAPDGTKQCADERALKWNYMYIRIYIYMSYT